MAEEQHIGRTPSDLIHKLLNELGLWIVLLIAISIFIAGWAFTHINAEPGTEVSVWGLFSYTKKRRQNPNSNSQKPSDITPIDSDAPPGPKTHPRAMNWGDRWGEHPWSP